MRKLVAQMFERLKLRLLKTLQQFVLIFDFLYLTLQSQPNYFQHYGSMAENSD